MYPNPKMLFVNASDSKICIRVAAIDVIEAFGNHSYIYIKSGEKIFVTNSLKDLTSRLENYHFCRIHRQYLINACKLYKIYTSDGGFIEMENGKKYPKSKQGKQLLMEILKTISV